MSLYATVLHIHCGFSPQLLESVDEFIAVLCHHLTLLTCGRDDEQQVKEILKESLPKMSCKIYIYIYI